MHRLLKEKTLLWAYDRGFRCCAMEVRAPRSRFRMDVAAVRLERTPSEHTVAVFECKQSREDLDRDNQRYSRLRTNLNILQERRDTLERLLAVHYPSLRTSDSLFPEWATFDFSAIDHTAYRQTIQKIACIHRQIFYNTKFEIMTHYRLGNLHYLVTTAELLHREEVPLGWGLLEVDRKEMIIEKSAPTRFAGVEIQRWLEQIAKASSLQNTKSVRERLGPSRSVSISSGSGR